MSEKTISVIIPVYNAEKTLSRCLDSIISQTFKNLEIILINDGSKDSSADICRKYASNDERIVFYETKNQGECATRNFGIEKASGEYIAFVDSDDYIDKTMYEKLISYDSDLVFCRFQTLSENGSIQKITDKGLFELVQKKDISNFFYGNVTMGCVWRMILKRTIACKVKFNPDIAYRGDLAYMMRIIPIANSISLCEEYLYTYYLPQDTYKKYHSPIKISSYKAYIEEILSMEISDELKKFISFGVFIDYCYVYYLNKKDASLKKQLKIAHCELGKKDNYTIYMKKIYGYKKKILAFISYHKMYALGKFLIGVFQ